VKKKMSHTMKEPVRRGHLEFGIIRARVVLVVVEDVFPARRGPASMLW